MAAQHFGLAPLELGDVELSDHLVEQAVPVDLGLKVQEHGAEPRPRLANSWRDRHYPNQRLDAASLVYTKAPQIIRAFEGAVIRSKRGRFLAIPTEIAPSKGTDGRRIRLNVALAAERR